MSSFCVEKAKSNRSSCRGCKVNIDKNELRMGVMNEHSDYGTTTKWYHLECFQSKVRHQPQNENAIHGYSSLTATLKSKVLSIVFDEELESTTDESESSTVESTESESEYSYSSTEEEESDVISNSNQMKNKKSRKRKEPDFDYSNTSSDESESESESDSNHNQRQKRKKKKKTNDMLHPPATKRSRLMSTINDNIPHMTVAQLKVYLKEYDLPVNGRKENLKERLSKFVNTPQKSKADVALLKKNIAEDKKEWKTICESLRILSVAQLKEKLKSNGMKRSGNKKVLVERIAECQMWGCFPRCPECGTATLNVRYPQRFGHKGQGKWQCPGYFDDEDFVRCGFRSTEEIERCAWNDN